MKLLLILLVMGALLSPLMAHAAEETRSAVVNFKIQEIDKSLKVGYAVKLVDLNGDGRLDILIPDSARVIWFENPGKPGAPWKLHTIIDNKAAGVIADNVCIDVYDIDGDGKLDIALGADWKPADTKAHGSLQWLRQPADIDQPWEVHPIVASEPTLHRMRFVDVDGSGKPQLVVAPLNGKGSSKEKLYADTGVRLLAFPIPKDPVKDSWEGHLITDELHVMHNIFPVLWGQAKGTQLLTASFEGVSLLSKTPDEKWSITHVGDGDQSNSKASHGAGEIKTGRLKGIDRILGTIEPFHGNQVVVYTPPAGAASGAWTRTVLDDTLKEGHAIWLADLDGDGNDEVIAGWRKDKPLGLRIYKAGPLGLNGAPTWQKFELDDGVAVEDLACADLDGDGRIDIVAVGRATGNVRIYWNHGR